MMSSPQSHLKPQHKIKLADAASVVQPAGSEVNLAGAPPGYGRDQFAPLRTTLLRDPHVTAMLTEPRKTGVDVVGDMPWGTHFCLFYETLMDLLEPLVLYCKAGLESQEFCLWIVAAPLTEEDARHALEQAVPDLHHYLADHSIEIIAARD